MFKTRLISGIILVAIAVLVIVCGGPVLLCTLAAISVIGMQELYRAMGIRTPGMKAEGKEDEGGPLLAIAGYLCIAAYYVMLWFFAEKFIAMMIVLSIIVLMFIYVFSYPKYHADQVMAAFFGIVYVGVMLSFVFLTRSMQPDGKFIVWLIFLCSWGCDTSAYCVGMLIGKHKMAPVLSPKKSVEGAIGGVIGSAVFAVIYGVLTHGHPFEYAVICACGALISMVGDLAASAIKRNKGIKDYGTLIPGHGGILDRFDSMIFTAPVIYYLATFMIRL